MSIANNDVLDGEDCVEEEEEEEEVEEEEEGTALGARSTAGIGGRVGDACMLLVLGALGVGVGLVSAADGGTSVCFVRRCLDCQRLDADGEEDALDNTDTEAASASSASAEEGGEGGSGGLTPARLIPKKADCVAGARREGGGLVFEDWGFSGLTGFSFSELVPGTPGGILDLRIAGTELEEALLVPAAAPAPAFVLTGAFWGGAGREPKDSSN